MRYKAYLNKIDLSTWKPGDKTEDVDLNAPIDEDDDLHILQHRLRNKGIETVKRSKIIDTFYEDRFNKRQQEIQSQLSATIKDQLPSVIGKYIGHPKNEENLNKIKNDMASVLSNMLGMQISGLEIYLKVDQNDPELYHLSLPAYNIYNIDFTLQRSIHYE